MDKVLPEPFVTRMKSLLGEDAYNDFYCAINSQPSVSVRLNPYKISLKIPELEDEEQVEWCDEGFYLKERPVFTLDPLLHGGAYYVQEASSMFLSYVLKQILPTEPIRCLDLCAAPGGKSTLMAAEIPHGSLLVSNEVIKSRASILKENIIKWGTGNVVVTNSDPSCFKPLEGSFDIILVDAPCSGEGMFRKDDRAISEWSEENLKICEERQKRILKDIWPALKPGGYLIYSTCTYNNAENEKMLEYIKQRFGASYVKINHTFKQITTGENGLGYRFLPHKTRGEGLFMGVMQKSHNDLCDESWTHKKEKRGNTKSIKLPKQLASLIKNSSEYAVYENSEGLGIIAKEHENFIALLQNNVHVIYKGCEVAQLMGEKVKLLPPFALFVGLNTGEVVSFDADRQTALTYLKREDISVAASNGTWVLVTYRGVALGWGKKVGNRLNNYYPKGWMIRMDIE